MTLKVLILLYSFVEVISSIYPFPKCKFGDHDKNYFCKREYSCLGAQHANTACFRAPCGPTRSCGTLYKSIPMTDTDREFVVQVHNTYRNRLATGLEFRYPVKDNTENAIYEPLANMKLMGYSKELEFVAQCWANNCLYNGWRHVHDKCRKTQIFADVGQNFFLYTHITPFTEKINYTHQRYLSKAVDTWYQEIHKFNYENYMNFTSNPATNNFTQLAWATTGYVGCARTQYGHGRVIRLIIYCNYGPRGNVKGEPVFTVSKNGSSCCEECEGRITYYYLFRGHNTRISKDGTYTVRFPNAEEKLKEFQQMGMDLSNKVEIGLTTHIYIFPGCSLNYSCLCGSDEKSVTNLNYYFVPPFEIASGNFIRYNSVILFTLLLCHTITN